MNRSEILFLYDINDANPNGDPLDSNKPRLDEETEINIVTDVRLKRTIRDYLKEYENQEIFIRDTLDEEGKLKDSKQRASDFLTQEKFESLADARENIKENVISECIDARLFGATIPIDVKVKTKKASSSVTLTGPVQFRMGRSLNKVEINHIKGTGAFASGEGKDQKTFREEYILPYSLINFYGVINENAAKETGMKDSDIPLLLKGIWNGTKNLITRSKFGQVPRLLLQIEYNENYFIGDLNNKISIEYDLDDSKLIRNINQVELNFNKLLTNLEEEKDKISKIYYKIDSDVKFYEFETSKDLLSKIESLGIETEELEL